METIFTVKNEDLERFNPDEAVDFFRELLWSEATANGISKNLINVPSAINVADGGIDAEVMDIESESNQGLIKKGLTRYQIKTGKFNISNESKINERVRPGESRNLILDICRVPRVCIKMPAHKNNPPLARA